MSHILSSTTATKSTGWGEGDERTWDVYGEQKHGTMEATKCKSRSFPPGIAPG